jgi:hypothetical protein
VGAYVSVDADANQAIDAHNKETIVNLKLLLTSGVLAGSLCLCIVGSADDHGRPAGNDAHSAPVRRDAPPFQPHPSGVHPRGRTVPPHQTRVLQPSNVQHGHTGWAHWNHPDFPRPNYYWNWAGVHNVTCVAEDSYGDQYPVTEAAAPGFGINNMTGVEDDALDRCYAESGQDSTCVLATCTHI